MKWLIEKWDWWIYARAHNTLRRMCQRNGGFAYLLELSIREWLQQHPISDDLKRSTEQFWELLSKSKVEGERPK